MTAFIVRHGSLHSKKKNEKEVIYIYRDLKDYNMQEKKQSLHIDILKLLVK